MTNNNVAAEKPDRKTTPTPSQKVVQEQLFSWEGTNKAKKIIKGESRSASEALLRIQLRKQGLTSVKIKKIKLARGRSITEQDIALFTKQLATMMKAGVPLMQSFEIVSQGTNNPAIALLLTSIKSDIETGNSLVKALQKHPKYFDSLFCSLVAAGEQAGILESILDRLATYKEKTLHIKRKVKSALFYPTAVIIVSGLVITVIMLFVIPAFEKIFSSFNAALPTPTVIVINLSNIFTNYWYIIFGIIFSGGYAFSYAWKTYKYVQIFMDNLSLKLPLFGTLVEKSVLSRWMRTLATMFAAGVPLVEALDTVAGAAGNHKYEVATKKIQQYISTGTSLTSAMQSCSIFPNMVIQMATIGEESGSLDTMLGKVADIYDQEIDEMVERLSSLMEPIIMSVLGIIIGGLVVAMYLPIFKLGEAA